MSYNKKYYELAGQRLELRRLENKRAEEARRAEVYEKIPGYVALEQKLAKDIMNRVLTAAASKAPDWDNQLKKALELNLKTQREMAGMLASHGYPEDYLDPIYTCPICSDKGAVDGKWCECFNRLLGAAAAEELNTQSPLRLSSFESFDLSFYSDAIDPVSRLKQSEIMNRNYKECKMFARDFSGRGEGLFMIGNTGLGKTHLSLAIANELIVKGFMVIYGSVPELLRRLEKETFGKADGDSMSLITECDLLILDDLGAETKSDRYISLLYEVINARKSRLLPMIVNTNLDMEQIKNRYHDRIWSRLFSMRVLLFCGEDNRLKTSNN